MTRLVYGSWYDGSDIYKENGKYYVIQWDPVEGKEYKKFFTQQEIVPYITDNVIKIRARKTKTRKTKTRKTNKGKRSRQHKKRTYTAKRRK